MKSDRFAQLQHVIQTLLNRLGALVFPAILIAISAFVLIWQMTHFVSPAGTTIPVRVWEQADNDATLTRQKFDTRERINQPALLTIHICQHNFGLTEPPSDARQA